MKIVRFVRSTPPYMAGERAGFDDEAAARLVQLGAAQYETEEPAGHAESSVETPPEAPKKRGR